MTGILIGGRKTGRHFALLSMAVGIPVAREIIESAQRAEAEAIGAELTRLGLKAMRSVEAFRVVVNAMNVLAGPAVVPLEDPQPAPRWQSARPYLKRKKGRS